MKGAKETNAEWEGIYLAEQTKRFYTPALIGCGPRVMGAQAANFVMYRPSAPGSSHLCKNVL